MFGLTRAELAALRRLNTPERVQDYLDRLPYNTEPDGGTLRSARRVHGRPPLLVDLEAEQDDDHVLAVTASAASGPRSRPRRTPACASVYRTVRELLMSYFDAYFNWDGDARSARRTAAVVPGGLATSHAVASTADPRAFRGEWWKRKNDRDPK